MYILESDWNKRVDYVILSLYVVHCIYLFVKCVSMSQYFMGSVMLLIEKTINCLNLVHIY